MITRFHVQNYKALQDVTLDLSPIHVLIGPNDSGKTSLLEAIAALCRSVDFPLAQAFAGNWSGRDLVWQQDSERAIGFDVESQNAADTIHYQLAAHPPASGRDLRVETESVRLATGETAFSFKNHQQTGVQSISLQGVAASEEHRHAAGLVHDALSGVQSYRWTPGFLALPVAPDSNRQFRMEPSGFGLALCLDDILGYDREAFIELERRFTSIFPEIESIKLIAEPAYKSPVNEPEQIPMLQKSDGKGIYFKLSGSGHMIRASQASDGVLLILAYLTVLHLPKPHAPRVVLVEEPENGIHPRRLEDVLNILRDLVRQQEHTQVVMTTHSPYVVDLFQPEEVTLCRKREDGSIDARRLSESRIVLDQLDVFTLGEIWTGEGDDALSPASSAEGEATE